MGFNKYGSHVISLLYICNFSFQGSHFLNLHSIVFPFYLNCGLIKKLRYLMAQKCGFMEGGVFLVSLGILVL